MTTLHWILIGFGIVLVGGVALYNYYQERRLRKQIDGMFSRERDNFQYGESIEAGQAIEGTDALSGNRPEGWAIQSDPVDIASETYDEMVAMLRHATGDGDSDLPTLAMPRADAEADLDALPEFQPASVTNAVDSLRQSSDAAAVLKQAPVEPAGIRTETPATVRPGAPTRPATPDTGKKPSPLDVEVEYIARLKYAHPVQVDFAKLLARLRRIGKPVRTFVLHGAENWLEVARATSQTCQVAEFGLQLADRNGALTQGQLDDFCNALYEFAAEHGGAVSCPDLRVALEKARELDAFCMDVDVLIGLNVVTEQGRTFSGELIDQLAVDAGMKLGSDGIYVLTSPDGQALFSLVNQQTQPFTPGGSGINTPGITLLFDVPKVANGLQVFDDMTTLGFQMAKRLGGSLMDDNGHAVTQKSLLNDRQQLATFYGRMEAFAVPAGGERALRLFA